MCVMVRSQAARSRWVVDNGSLIPVNGCMQARAGNKMLLPEDCTSLIEAFTEEQILNHIRSLDTGLHIDQPRIKVWKSRDAASSRGGCQRAYVAMVYSHVALGGYRPMEGSSARAQTAHGQVATITDGFMLSCASLVAFFGRRLPSLCCRSCASRSLAGCSTTLSTLFT